MSLLGTTIQPETPLVVQKGVVRATDAVVVNFGEFKMNVVAIV
jgi:hypothetical protein